MIDRKITQIKNSELSYCYYDMSGRECIQKFSFKSLYNSPSILQPSILRPPLIIRLLDLVPKDNFLC